MRWISSAPVVIIGMHRSGTTLLAEGLARGGVTMGNDPVAYAESNFFQRCNVELLRGAQAHWDRPVVTSALPTGFTMRGLISEYAGVVKHPTGWWPLLFDKRWGWKDPRNTFTLGSWLRLFPKLHAVHIYRNGIDVARSLYARNAMLQPGSVWHSPLLTDLTACFDLWERYVLQAMAWKKTLGNRFTALRYEDLVALKPEVVEKLESCTGKKMQRAFASIVDRNRGARDVPLESMDALKDHARSNQTLFRLGYA